MILYEAYPTLFPNLRQIEKKVTLPLFSFKSLKSLNKTDALKLANNALHYDAKRFCCFSPIDSLLR